MYLRPSQTSIFSKLLSETNKKTRKKKNKNTLQNKKKIAKIYSKSKSFKITNTFSTIRFFYF